MQFPTYSESKYFSIKPDIIELGNNTEEPMFDLILRVEILASIGVVLDFGTKSILINHISDAMQYYKVFKDTSKLYQIAREEQLFPRRKLELISTQEAIKRAVTILDAKYKKSDPSAIVNDNFSHLDSIIS